MDVTVENTVLSVRKLSNGVTILVAPGGEEAVFILEGYVMSITTSPEISVFR